MRKLFLLLIGVVVAATSALAQRTISGKVTDENGTPLPKVSILVPGTTAGVTTSEDGSYSLNIPGGTSKIIFSSVGMATKEVALMSGVSVYNIQMTAITKSLDEVLVVGYGRVVKKSDFTGSANQTNYEDFKNRPILNPINALVATGPGVQTTASNGSPGSSPGVRVRGFGSISAGSAPLYVVDGTAYDGGIANINSEDIESITTLKDAATTALWGSRAANGVIMITTKKGKKNRNNVTFKALLGFSTRGLPEYERVDAYQYYPLMWEAMRNSLQYTSGQTAAVASQNATNGIKTQLGYNPFGGVANNDIVRTDGKLNPSAQLMWADDVDWTKELIRTGTRQDYAISYSGGTEKSDYFSSFGFTNEKGFIIRSDWRRFTGRLNVNTQALSWLKTGLNVSASINNSNQASDGSSTGYVNPFFFSRSIGPIYPVYAHDQTTGAYLTNSQGVRFYDYGNLSAMGIPNRPGGASPGRHVIEETKLNQSLFKRNTISGRSYATVTFTPSLKFTTNISVDLTDYNASTYDNNKVGDGAPAGRASKTNSKTTSYTFNQLLDYNKKIKQHNISFLLGHENYDYTYDYFYGFKQGQVLEGIYEFENFSTINSLTSRVDKYRIESYFGRFNYDLNGKYFISGNIRSDGNSRFAKDVRWENFWGVGFAWRLDKEKIFEHANFINSLKLRTSYGQLGNDNVGTYYAYQAFYSLGYNNAAEPGALQSQLENIPLTWESNNTFDLGVDFALFKNRIRGSFEFYDRRSVGLIFDVQTPLSTGGFVVPTNIGNMYNKGIEAEIAADVFKSKDFNWELKINASTIKNRITKMPDANPEQISGTKKYSVGHSIYDYWLRDWYGVDPQDGAALYRFNIYNPANCRIIDKGMGKKDTVTTDQNNGKYIYAGSSIPKLYGGIENTFTYAGFELNILLQYQIGGKVYDGTYAALMHTGTYGTALHKDALNRWTKPGDITNVPRMDNSKGGVYDAASSRWLIDASFLNVRSITLSYKMPTSLVEKMSAASGSFFVGAENVALFSKRYGMNVNQSFDGTTSNVYTPARIITAGFTFNF
ncbi:MAG: SusC/RagA family TonB-linked outer membrane protein [Chitinophagaceae bacterium]|nr:SusC/RagA family TonB-linked outer membrane protein [Chitinophagaceae bacterium]